MPEKICLDCGKPFEVEPDQISWRNHCYDCWKIRKTLKDQGLSKEEIERVRQLAHPKRELKKLEEMLEPDAIDYTTTEVLRPTKEQMRQEHEEMKTEYEGFVGEIPKKGMQFKEISVSLGEKVSADFQSKNVQVGAVISVGGVSVELAYQSALNEVKNRLKEEVKRIREEML